VERTQQNDFIVQFDRKLSYVIVIVMCTKLRKKDKGVSYPKVSFGGMLIPLT